jgi:NTP pyrophosphatase (non-canonical NTP hydrolase)
MNTFKEYQEISAGTAIYLNKIKEQYPNLPPEILKVLGISYVANGMGEVGEIQGKVKKIIRDAGTVITDETRKEISKEIGDVLWYCAALCRELDLSLEEVAQKNIEKLLSRKERGVLVGNGDNR